MNPFSQHGSEGVGLVEHERASQAEVPIHRDYECTYSIESFEFQLFGELQTDNMT